MNIQLPSELTESVRSLVLQGRFASEEEAFVEGVQLLVARERLRSDIELGIGQLERGQSRTADEVFDSLTNKIQALAEQRKND